MKLSAIALLVSTVSLAFGIYGVAEVSRIRDEIGRTRQPRERLVVAEEPTVARAPRRRDADRDVAREAPARAAEERAADNAPRATLEERVERLEKDQERMRETTRHMPAMPFRGRRFARSVDDLATTLKLTPTQKERVTQAVERGKRQIEEIMKIPDESGKSPYERRQERHKKLLEAVTKKDTGGVIAFAGDMLAYRKQQIPGRNATYGEEIDRVKKETRDEIATSLDVEQRKALQETDLDPLLGGGGTMALSVIQTTAGDGEGAVVDESIEIEGGFRDDEQDE